MAEFSLTGGEGLGLGAGPAVSLDFLRYPPEQMARLDAVRQGIQGMTPGQPGFREAALNYINTFTEIVGPEAFGAGIIKKVGGAGAKALGIAPTTALDKNLGGAKKALAAKESKKGLSVSPTTTRAFKAWFKKSKVVDESGEPIVMYHGTADDIRAFNLDHPNRKDTGWLGTGVYLTTDARLAGSYATLKRGREGPNVMPLYAKMENPYYATQRDKERIMMISHNKGAEAGRKAADKFTDDLKAKGHDGVILEFRAEDVGAANVSREMVVFDPAGVKSAIGNRGTFSASDINILRSGIGGLGLAGAVAAGAASEEGQL